MSLYIFIKLQKDRVCSVWQAKLKSSEIVTQAKPSSQSIGSREGTDRMWNMTVSLQSVHYLWI